MSKRYALWFRPDRNITAKEAGQICERAIAGDTASLPSHDAIRDIAKSGALQKILANRFNLDIHKDNFCFMDNIFGGSSQFELLDYAVKHGLLLYNYSSETVLCCAGRYGLGDYTIYLENGSVFDNPERVVLHDCIHALGARIGFAVLEGPVGYVQTECNDDGTYVAEWNRGSLRQHYTLDDTTDADTVVDIFSAFIKNDTELLNCYDWVKLDRS